MLKKLYIAPAFLLVLVPLASQTVPSAHGGPGATIWVGAAVSMFNPDYGCKSNSPFSCWEHELIGVGPYVYTSPFLLGRVGGEAELRMLLWHGPATLIEYSYMGGPRVQIFRYKKVDFSARILFGQAHLDLAAPAVGGGSYFAYAPGAAVDYRVSRHVAARFDYEYQRWPGFPSSTGGSGGLTPNGFSVGLSYAIH